MGKIIKNAFVIFLLLTLGASTVLLAYLHFFASNDRDLSGEWSASLDMTQQAAVSALGWLQDIEAVSVSLEDMEPYMQELTVQVDMSLEQTGPSEGTFRCHVVQESYDACRQAAYEDFAAVFLDLLTERLHMAGYTGSTDREAVEALVTETFGMSAVSYLMACGPALLPSLEDLQAQFDSSGTYEAAEDILTRRVDTGGAVVTEEEYYIRKGSTLILSGKIGVDSSGLFSVYYPVIYLSEGSSEQESSQQQPPKQ